MINDILRHLLRFILLVLVQALILKNINLGVFVNPFLYVLFLIQLPFQLPAWMGLLISFFTGMSIDMFYSTPGMHTTVCTFIGFMRPRLLSIMAPRDGYESGLQPTMQYMGSTWFITYASIIVVLHHVLLFFLEMLSFHEFFWTLLRAGASAIATMLLVVVTQLLFYRNKASA